jgi:molecular chaperone DnaK
MCTKVAVFLVTAIQAAILVGHPDVDDVLLMDVTPLTLGVALKGDIMLQIIARNTLIPAHGE